MKYAPIVLFVYNRPIHTQATVEALKANPEAAESELFVFADGPKAENDEKVIAVRNYLSSIEGFKNIHLTLRDRNLGLADSIIAGVTEVINKYGRVIVMEDDLVTAPFFLKYMNDALEKYDGCEKVFAITGYSYFPNGNPKLTETYFLQNMSSWTWATWSDKWDKFDPDAKGWERMLTDRKYAKKFDHNGCFSLPRMMKATMIDHTINSWAVRWCYSAFVNDGLSLFPNRSLVANLGFDGTGTNCEATDSRDSLGITLADGPVTFFPDDIYETSTTYSEINSLYRRFRHTHYRERILFYLGHINKIPAKIKKCLNGKF